MKIKYLLSIIINIILLISLVNAQTVSHPASQVTSGTFGTGDFTFQNNLAVLGDLTIKKDAFAKLKIDSGVGVTPGFSSVDFYDGGAPDWGLGKDSSGNFYIDQSGVSPPYITILPGGNVGIGTTSPSLQLEVKQSSASASAGIELENSAGTTTQLRMRGASESGGSRFSIVQNANDAFTISNTGNVGIGTTSPSQKLDVENGYIAMSNGYGILWDSLTYIKGLASGDIQFAPSNSEKMRITSAGNVGIGTTAPGYAVGAKLDVRGDVLAKSKLYLANSGFNAGDDDTFILDGSTSGKLKFSYRWAGGPTTYDRMIIDNNGNVGIGITNPMSKLDVAGSGSYSNRVIHVAGDINPVGYDSSTSGARVGFTYGTAEVGGVRAGVTNGAVGSETANLIFSTANAGTLSEKMRITSAGNIGIGSVNPGAKLDVTGNIKASGTICDGSNNCIGSGSLWTDTGTNTYLTQTTDNVGIGTSIPGAKLHVVGNANTLRVEGIDHTYIEFYPDGPSPRKAYFGFPDDASDDIRLKNEIATGDIILEPGVNVGIGTTGPNSKLHVEGEMASVRTGTSNVRMLSGTNPAVLHRNDGSNYYVLLTNNADQWGSWNTLLPFRINLLTGDVFAGSNALTVKHGGNVGIGNTVPQERLHVGAGGDASGLSQTDLIVTRAGASNLAVRDSANDVESMLYTYSGGGIVGTFTNHNFAIRTNNADRITVDNTGNVGIGMTGPQDKLDVNNVLRVTGTSPLVRYYDNDAAVDFKGYQVQNVDGKLYFGSITDALAWKSPNTLVLDNDGDVGIGTPTPGAKLDVAGSILSNGQLVCLADGTNCPAGPNLNGWSFGNDYFYDDGEEVIRANDEWIRLNQAGNFLNGVYTPTGLRADGGLAAGAYALAAGEVRGTLFRDGTSGYAADPAGNSYFNALQANSFYDLANPTYLLDPANSLTSAILAGNVGIGTTNPNYPLTVNGPVVAGPGALAGPAYMFYPTTTYGATGMYAPASNTVGFVTGASERVRIDSTGNVGIGTTTIGSKLTVAGTIESTSGGIKFPDGTTQSTAATSGLWSQLGSDIYYNNGNVGIGTTTVSQKLHIFGGDVQIEDIAPVIYFRENDQIDPAGWWRLAGDGDQLSFRRRTVAGTWTGEGYPLRLYRSSGDVRIGEGSGYVYYDNSLGSVGIGTTNPGAKLEVFAGTLTGTQTALRATQNDATGWGLVIGNNALDTSNFRGLRMKVESDGDGLIESYTALPTPAAYRNILLVPSGGNVGIGTTNPAALLEVNGDPGTDILFIVASGPTEVMKILESGNVGIGTTSPKAKLDVSGNIKAGTSSGIGSFLFNSFGNPDNSDDLNQGADESDRDVYIEDDLEVDGQIFVTGGYVVNSDIAEVLLTKKGRENVLCSADAECWKERKIELESYERELEFGDLVCGSNKIANVIEKCAEANSKLVVGFVSNTSAFNMGNNLRFGYPIAVAGVVWSKVSNANGNINPGDLLVSAEKDGYAMKNDNPKDGTVVGKAFDFCYEEECSILVFVALS